MLQAARAGPEQEQLRTNQKIQQISGRPHPVIGIQNKAIATLLTLTRLTKKDGFDITKDDIDDLVFRIARLYSNQKGQETNTTVDCKKHLKMFFRWMKFGSRSFKAVGDPEETRSVKINRVQDKLVLEDLVTESDFTRMIHVCKNNRTKSMISFARRIRTRRITKHEDKTCKI